MEAINHEDTKLTEQNKLLSSSRDATKAESKKLDNEIKNINQQMTVIRKNIHGLHHESKILIEDIMNNISEQSTIYKASENLKKQAKKILHEVTDKDAEAEITENEIARVMIDVKNTEQWIKVLKGKHEDISKDLAEREEIVKRYEKQIR